MNRRIETAGSTGVSPSKNTLIIGVSRQAASMLNVEQGVTTMSDAQIKSAK
jgi:hypothetical protein